MSYRHLTQAGIEIGKPLELTLNRTYPDDPTPVTLSRKVEGFAGGGFYGSVIMLGSTVVKTAQPDAFHDLLRQWNWPVPFPSRWSKNAAKLDYLSGRLIGSVITPATGIAVPKAEGYTGLPGQLGYGQAIERIDGRGPTFLDGGEENEKIRQARQRIWDTGVEFGIEAAAQAHPKNPFGKPNVWLNNEGHAVWLDYLPAIRHTGYVKPFFWYGFHKKVRDAFEVGVPTYNRIHINLLGMALKKPENLAKFTVAQRREISYLMDSYEDISERFYHEQNKTARSLFINEGLTLGKIEPAQHDRYCDDEALYRLYYDRQSRRYGHNTLLYRLYRARQTGGLVTRSAIDFANATPLRALWSKEPWRNAKQFFTNREYFLESTILRGIKKARSENLITGDEYQRTVDIISKKDMKLYTAMQAGYFAVSRLADVATVPLAVVAAKSSDPSLWAAGVVGFNTLAPGAIRATGTVIVSKFARRNLNKMALFSAIPIAGTYLAVPGQMKRDYGEKEAKVMHYNLRALATGISKLRPHGGWGSDLEEKIWNKGLAAYNLGVKVKNKLPFKRSGELK